MLHQYALPPTLPPTTIPILQRAQSRIQAHLTTLTGYPHHQHARGSHPSYPDRALVPDEDVSWLHTPATPYTPTDFTHSVVRDNDCTRKPGGWADPMECASVDMTQRESYVYGDSPIVCDALQFYPFNPAGRTGIRGRGLLGKWGPNHAADPIVTRYDPARPTVLQMVAIQRDDTGHWAIPGGMVDYNETVSVTLRREFQEEATKTGMNPALLDKLFAVTNGRVVYRGYVDDPRNTDNAWMETCAVHFHCDTELGQQLALEAGYDAVAVQWIDIVKGGEAFEGLYATHRGMVWEGVRGMVR